MPFVRIEDALTELQQGKMIILCDDETRENEGDLCLAAVTVSIDARAGISTGISAPDRAHTILTTLDPRCQPDDLARPGHVFPLRARPGGVLERRGQTEGAVDLARLAGLQAAGVICEIMHTDGTMARRAQLEQFASLYELKMLTIAELVQYRQRQG
jgi:3,4-dihydroxy 2-butanone 4-phosphate synthase/GTP cyclohydrolase II